jgi:hypothetical protein
MTVVVSRVTGDMPFNRNKELIADVLPYAPQPRKQYSFKQEWLSDPATYPIIVIMGGGLTFMVGMGFNALFGYKDVQINPNKRGAMLQDWGQEHRSGVVETLILAKGGVKAEGLGIDHEEWAKTKEAYLKK